MRHLIIAVAALTAMLAGCATQAPVREAAPVTQAQAPAKPEATPAKPAPKPAAAPAAKPAAVAPATQPAPTRIAPEPGTLSSLQPFRQFGKGQGLGIARQYRVRTKADFVALLRDPKRAQRELRVSCERLVRQLAEAHNLPFEGCEGAAHAIETDPNFGEAACTDDMFTTRSWLIVTNNPKTEKDRAFGAWHRKCYPNERVLTYKGQPIMSLTCINGTVPISIPPPPAPKLPAPTPVVHPRGCPDGFSLFSNAWEMGSVRAADSALAGRVEALIKKTGTTDSANAKDMSAYMGDRVSRTEGDNLINNVQVRAPVGVTIAAQLIDPSTAEVVQDLGTFELIDGVVRIPLTAEQITYVIETLWPAWFSSPTVSGGKRRLRFLPPEWVKPGGGRWCSMQQHGSYYERNKR